MHNYLLYKEQKYFLEETIMDENYGKHLITCFTQSKLVGHNKVVGFLYLLHHARYTNHNNIFATFCSNSQKRSLEKSKLLMLFIYIFSKILIFLS